MPPGRRNRGQAVRRGSGGEVRECEALPEVKRVESKVARRESWRERGWTLRGRRAERGRSPEKIAKELKFTSDTPPKKNKELINQIK